MGNDKLTLIQALKFARHDFLNELQLILLYIDLGKLPEAKQKILETTDAMRQTAMLERLGLPAVEAWLVTFDWVYSVFHKTITSTITTGIRQVDDAVVVAYLEQVFQTAEKLVDPTSDYEAQIAVNATSTNWSITIIVNGVMDNMLAAPQVTGNFIVEETISQHQWMFTISGQ
ncbi:Spo0B domain-containing protein [Sporosarcina sp. YIM B06819]|uniref:Spo0B domain-containing protein n=1 Tax=Sporosarcina sp. YIM B06819 TaxID=3081769 RepID=UPI00298C33AB|nr:Spo0B domain-containing protein [Sporosarcina sp. YIM B06819]